VTILPVGVVGGARVTARCAGLACAALYLHLRARRLRMRWRGVDPKPCSGGALHTLPLSAEHGSEHHGSHVDSSAQLDEVWTLSANSRLMSRNIRSCIIECCCCCWSYSPLVYHIAIARQVAPRGVTPWANVRELSSDCLTRP
jgi:hypothetical protein